jgi:hypothetical protein
VERGGNIGIVRVDRRIWVRVDGLDRLSPGNRRSFSVVAYESYS